VVLLNLTNTPKHDVVIGFSFCGEKHNIVPAYARTLDYNSVEFLHANFFRGLEKYLSFTNQRLCT